MSDTLRTFSVPSSDLSEAANTATQGRLDRMKFGKSEIGELDDITEAAMVRRRVLHDGKKQTEYWYYISRPDTVSGVPFWVGDEGQLIIGLMCENKAVLRGAVVGFPEGFRSAEEGEEIETMVAALKVNLGVDTTIEHALSHSIPAAAIASDISNVRNFGPVPFCIGTKEDLQKIGSGTANEWHHDVVPHWIALSDLSKAMSTLETAGETPSAQLAAFAQGYKLAKLEQELGRQYEESRKECEEWSPSVGSVKETWDRLSISGSNHASG